MPARLRWTLKETLERHGISAYKLVEQSELSKRTVYENLVHGRASRVDLETLERVLSALEELLERPVELTEILFVEWNE
jgi:DNA-binding Xre family transcriptional regulator